MTNELSVEEAIELLKEKRMEINYQVNGTTQFSEALKMGIKALEQTRWIPVSERLPEDFGGDYLVNIEYKGGHEGTDIATYCIGGYLDGLWDTPNDWIEGPSELWHVTAWMPLPQPYVPDTNVGEMGESEE